MIPKEIQEQIDAESELRYPVKRHNNPSDSPYVHSQITFRHGVRYGYQLATDGREELEKENGKLKLEKDRFKQEANKWFEKCEEGKWEKEAKEAWRKIENSEQNPERSVATKLNQGTKAD